MSEEKKDASEAGGEEVVGGQIEGVPPKINTSSRFLAVLIDGGIAFLVSLVGLISFFVLSWFSGFLGALVLALSQGIGAGYLALRDSLNDGRSFGKKIMKLTVQTPDGRPCTQEQSLKRNSIFALPLALVAIATVANALVGWIPLVGFLTGLAFSLAVLIASLGNLFEAIQVLVLDPNGRRLMELKSETYTVLGE